MKYKRELSTPCFSNCTLTLVKHSTHPIKQSSPDLGSLGVQSDGNAGVHSVLLFVHLVGNPDVVDGFSMILVRSRICKELTMRATSTMPLSSPVREIHPGNVHPVLDELQEDLRRPADWSDGADNARQPHLVGCGVHVEVGDVLDVGVALPRPLLARGNIALLQDGLRRKNFKLQNKI